MPNPRTMVLVSDSDGTMTRHDFYSPFSIPPTGIDQLAVVKHALAQQGRVAFAGDGPPDPPPAKLIPAHWRFARGFPARALTAGGESYQPLSDWKSLADHLMQSSAS